MVVGTPPAVDTWAIFLQTRSAVTSAQYPWRIDYTIAITGIRGGTNPTTDHYGASCDPSDGSIRVFSTSGEQLAQPPPVPHGFDFNLTATICGGRCDTGVGSVALPVGHPALGPDIIGVPVLTPTYMFGLRYPHVPGSGVSQSRGNPLPIIATVSTQARDYQVTFVDIATIDGVPTYHLRLKPLRKPKDNRLRELWVGTGDYLPRKAAIAGNFTVAPLVDVPWVVDFTVINGAPYVVRERAENTLYLSHRRVVQGATIAFQNIGEPSNSIYDRPLLEPDETATTLVEPGPR